MNTECTVDVEQSRADRTQGTVMLLKMILLSAVLIEVNGAMALEGRAPDLET